MNRGIWHQCGDKSQNIVDEQLSHGVGVGVILSARDLPMHHIARRASDYRDKGAQVLIDQQFYVPGFTGAKLNTYPICRHRAAITQMYQISNADLTNFASDLEQINSAIGAEAIIAPAVIYEAARTDIVDLNARLFDAAKQVGDNMGIPTYATVVLGRSATTSNQVLDSILSQVSALNSDGWYYSFEFDEERIPSSYDAVLRSCSAGLTLACTNKPVLHAYAGPMSILSFGFGATAAAIGHTQNLWHFNRDRWAPSSGQGGGGDAPARFFSSSLWGTIVYPDETQFLGAILAASVLSSSPFSGPVSANLHWGRWDSYKHLLYRIGVVASTIAGGTTARLCAQGAISQLNQAVALHQQVANVGLVALKDQTDTYQQNWAIAMQNLLNVRSADYDLLELFQP